MEHENNKTKNLNGKCEMGHNNTKNGKRGNGEMGNEKITKTR